MRIITGTLKGRRIQVPGNLDVRPTTDRTKEGLFSTIESWKYIRDSMVLDLFAGSGNLGFEALSRGARSALFIDEDRRNTAFIESLAEDFEISDRVRTVTADVRQFLEGPAVPYDFIFADPPYNYSHLEEVVRMVIDRGWLKENGWMIAEHNTYYDFRDHPNSIMEKEYGRSLVSFFSAEADQSDEEE